MSLKNLNISDNMPILIPLTPWSLLVAQVLAHMSIIPMIMYATMSHWLVSLAIYMFLGTAITVTYHRLLAHRSWQCSKIMEKILVLLCTLSLSGSAIVWTSVHRLHHKHHDTPKDPHSPVYRGFIKSQWGNMFIKISKRNVLDLLRDKFMLFQHQHYFTIVLVWCTFLYLMDPFSLVYAFLFPAMLVWNFGCFIFTISHRDNKPHNDIILALTSWGEGYHKNHHDNPGNYRFGKWDLGGFVIDKIKQ